MAGSLSRLNCLAKGNFGGWIDTNFGYSFLILPVALWIYRLVLAAYAVNVFVIGLKSNLNYVIFSNCALYLKKLLICGLLALLFYFSQLTHKEAYFFYLHAVSRTAESPEQPPFHINISLFFEFEIVLVISHLQTAHLEPILGQYKFWQTLLSSRVILVIVQSGMQVQVQPCNTGMNVQQLPNESSSWAVHCSLKILWML